MGSFYIGFYRYNQTFYTGTDAQPDVLHLFVKPEKSFIEYTAMPLGTGLGYLPICSFFSGAARVANAVKVIFKGLSTLKPLAEDARKAELWNAFKNLFRGIAEMVPFTGIALILFDSIRSSVYCEKTLEKIKEQENVAGVAIDGKIVFTLDLTTVDHIIKNTPEKLNERRLAIFREICLTWLKKAEEKGDNRGVGELFQDLQARYKKSPESVVQ
ncbi:hypothetical protein [Parachlamydia sp. AcF125]|uniref:hypothetical protein n=1 Tax=Parachlamydia sp. AcF125 TaxID=2795736 RepID=UPI001BC9961E|nr:hypothetical protein [Parachlamydia sp. AcF125]MBS4167992.1 hypothetical protein [Parachlamydia sp. AcF125]